MPELVKLLQLLASLIQQDFFVCVNAVLLAFAVGLLPNSLFEPIACFLRYLLFVFVKSVDVHATLHGKNGLLHLELLHVLLDVLHTCRLVVDFLLLIEIFVVVTEVSGVEDVVLQGEMVVGDRFNVVRPDEPLLAIFARQLLLDHL